MAFAAPKDIIPLLTLKPGERVADFGGGNGAHAVLLAQAVGAAGQVYVVDVQNELLEKVRHEAEAAGFDNVSVVWGDLERPTGSKLKDASVDVVLISNTLFQIDARYQVALETKRVLKSGGRVLVVEWRDSFGGMGPQPETVVREPDIKGIFNQAGFSFVRESDMGDHHRAYLFSKA